MNAGGEAVVAWTRDRGPEGSTIEARVGTVAAAAFAPLQPLASESSPDEDLSDPEVAIGPGGEAVAVWSRSAGDSGAIELAVRPPGAAAFGPAQTLLAGAFAPRIGIDPASGTAVIAFVRGTVGSLVPSATLRPPGGAPGPVEPLAPPNGSTVVASLSFDASGAALVAWTRFLSNEVRLAEASRRPPGGAFGPAALIADMGIGAGWRSPPSPTATPPGG